jgi:hypothetical protein
MIEIPPQGILAVALLLLFIFSSQKFNTPPTNRSNTTFVMFYVGVLLYFFMFVAVWVCIMALLESGGAALLNLKFNPANKPFLPLIAAIVVVIALHSNYEFIKNTDEAARQFCMRLASIPVLAERLKNELADEAAFRVIDEGLKAKIIEKISTNIGPHALNFTNDKSLSSRFTRAISLYWLFVQPYNNKIPPEFLVSSSGKLGYDKLMGEGNTADQANSHYEALMQLGAAYFASVRPVRDVEDPLRKIIQEISRLVCGLIARFVLLQEKTPKQRYNRLSGMGFEHYNQIPVLSIGQWAVSIFVIAILTLLIVRVTPLSTPIDEAFLRVVVFALQIGVSIAAGTVVAQRFIVRSVATREIFLALELTVACLIVITISAILRIGSLILSATLLRTGEWSFAQILNEFLVNRWSSVILPVTNTISVALLCSYLNILNLKASSRVAVGAICNGLAFVAAGFGIGIVLPQAVLGEVNVNPDTARLTIMRNSGVIGAAAGALVLAMFRRTKRGVPMEVSPKMPVPDGNGAVHQSAAMSKGESAEKDLGAYSRANVEELEGSYLCFRPMFTKPDIINLYLIEISWDVRQSCLTFIEKHRADSDYAQSGKIYIPNARPFINLVTTSKGDVRLITVCRPDARGLARGLIMTLSAPGGLSFIPASAPVVLRRLGDEPPPRFRFVHPGEPDYDFYQGQLHEVFPSYGVFRQPALTSPL